MFSNASGKFEVQGKHWFALIALMLSLTAGTAGAQVTAAITGTIRDTSGAIVPEAAVTVRNVETGTTRTAQADANGNYNVPSLAVGQYEVTVEKSGFKQQIRRGITLVVGQQAVVNLTLQVGDVEQQVTVTAEAPLVNTTLSSTSGLIGEKEVKDLPLNGRSFDQLLTLNSGTTNYSSNRSATQPGNLFSVAGRRPEENRFLMNGVEYVGASGGANTVTPNGSNGQVLGVDAVREFNVVQHTYGAEYGKRAGGQISIVTSSGTNQLHGDVFEFLRNSVLDARNFFDYPNQVPGGGRIPPFKRNQFGASLGGPLKKDKAFLFGTYEGFRQRLGISNVAYVPDNFVRAGFLPDAQGNPQPVAGLQRGMLPFVDNFWPAPNGPEVLNANGTLSGIATNYSNPLQKVREDYGLIRHDFMVSAKDSFSANYMVQDGENDTPSANPNFISITFLRSQLFSGQETHVFSPTLLNVATVGFSRANILAGTPPAGEFPANLSFISGQVPGGITIAGSLSGASGGSITGGGGSGFSTAVRNFFTYADDLHYVHGKHSVSAGVWVQRLQTNTNGTSTYKAGRVSYSTLTALLTDSNPTFQAETNSQLLGFRTLEAAWYLQDEIKLKPNFTLRLGLRDEMTNGWNEVTGRCSNNVFDQNGFLVTQPIVGDSCLTENHAKLLLQPRVGFAWDPTGTGTWAVRAGAGIYRNLQDNLAQKVISNEPFNERVNKTGPLLSFIPIPGGTQPPPACSPTQPQPCSSLAPGGVTPNFLTPLVQQWSLTVERALTRDLALQVGYVGSEAYHIQYATDPNTVPPLICTNPAGCVSGGVGSARGLAPQGVLYEPVVATRPNQYWSSGTAWFYGGTSSYNGLNVSLIKRASHGITFKTNYTWAKVLDELSAPDSATGTNEVGVILSRYALNLNKGPAAFNLTHQFNTNFSYELPFGQGQRWGSGAGAVTNRIIGGWQWNGILSVQSGFPLTLQAGSNRSGDGNSGSPDVPSRNPAFSGPIILGTPNAWFNSQAFVLPIAGTFGNLGRGALSGPALAELDTSFFKKISINERWNLQFRAEVFNILNHANFGVPNRTVFSGTATSPTAGLISTTATSSRQIQFALKVNF